MSIQTWRHCQIEIFLRLGFLDLNLAFFSPGKFKISWPSRILSIHRCSILSIWFRFSLHHTLKHLFLIYWTKYINAHCGCIRRLCLPLELMYIQHNCTSSTQAWKFECGVKRHCRCAPWYQRYISSPSSSFSVRWN